MTLPNLPFHQRAAGFAVLVVLAVVYISSTASDETHLAKSPLRPPTNAHQAAYIHAVTSGFRILHFTPEGVATIILHTREIHPARAAFLVKAYAFMRKAWADDACRPIQSITVIPYAFVNLETADARLEPFAELTLTREAAEQIDWSLGFPDTDRFLRDLARHGHIRVNKNTDP